MKPKFYLIALFVFCFLKGYTQTVDEILRNAKVLGKNDKLFLEFEHDNTLQYYVGKGDKDKATNFLPFDKSHPYLLIKSDAVNVYIRPVNPINYSVDAQIKYSVDSIDFKFNSAAEQLSKAFKKTEPTARGGGAACDSDAIANILLYVGQVDKALQVSQNGTISEIFNSLKALTFEDQKETGDNLAAIKPKITALEKYYHNIDSVIKIAQGSIKSLDCNPLPTKILIQDLYTTRLTGLIATEKAQKQKVANLNRAYSLAKAMYDQASKIKDGTLTWVIRLQQAGTQDQKLTDLIVTLNKSGFEMSKDSDVVETKTSTVATYTIEIRKFNHFIPEVAAGIVYSNLSYNKYGTATDANGNTIVAGSRNNVSKFSVSTMINLNYYIPNSMVHPFLQAGVGTSTDYQALFLGIGLRTQYMHGVTFSVGGASPWIKSLKTLKEGDKVSGTTAINDDLQSDISWFNKIYFGIQVKL